MNAVLIRANGLTIAFQCNDVAAFAKQANKEIGEAARTGAAPIVRAFLSDDRTLSEFEVNDIPAMVHEHRASIGVGDPTAVLAYIRNCPGQRGETIAAEFKTDLATLMQILHGLAAQYAIRSEGDGLATTYWPGRSGS